MLRLGILAGALAVALLAGGCGGPDVVRPKLDVSIGQQLIDLKKARDAGALTDHEFQRQKDQLIDSIR